MGLLDNLLGWLQDSRPRCVGVGLSGPAGDTSARVRGAVGMAHRLDELQWRYRAGPIVEASGPPEVVTSPDLLSDPRWPALAEVIGDDRARMRKPLGTIAVSGPWTGQARPVISAYLAGAPTDCDIREVHRFEPIIGHACASIELGRAAATRAEQMAEMVRCRAAIEQAKGMVMTALRCDAGAAFRVLVRGSQHFNVKVRDLAVALVEQVGQAPAEYADAYGDEAWTAASAAPADAATRRAAELVWRSLRLPEPSTG